MTASPAIRGRRPECRAYRHAVLPPWDLTPLPETDAGPTRLTADWSAGWSRPARDIHSSCCFSGAGLTAGLSVYAAGHFAMTRRHGGIISTRHDWRQRELAYERRSRRCKAHGRGDRRRHAGARRGRSELAWRPRLRESPGSSTPSGVPMAGRSSIATGCCSFRWTRFRRPPKACSRPVLDRRPGWRPVAARRAATVPAAGLARRPARPGEAGRAPAAAVGAR